MNVAALGRFATRDPSATGWGFASTDPLNDARPAGAFPHMCQHCNNLAKAAVNYTVCALPGLQDRWRTRYAGAPPPEDTLEKITPRQPPRPEPPSAWLQPYWLPYARKPPAARQPYSAPPR